MKKLVSENSKITTKYLQKWYFIIAVVIVISSQLFSRLEFSYVGYILGVVGISILGSSNISVIAIRRYNGTYNFIFGAISGLIVCSLPGIIIFKQYGLIGVLIIWTGWTLGGYIGIKDQIEEKFNLQIIVYIFWMLFFILLGIILSVLILALMMVSNIYIRLSTFVIAGILITRYSRKKLLSKYLRESEKKPNAFGMFGAFVGGIIGLVMSLLVRFISRFLMDFPMDIGIVIYIGLAVGAIVGFSIGYKYESVSDK